MNKNKLEFSIRKNKGKAILNRYENLFVTAGFEKAEIEYVGLERSDEVLYVVRHTFPNLQEKTELLEWDSDIKNSQLITSAFQDSDNFRECYIYSDDVYYCGMYIAQIGYIKKYCLNVARKGYSNTCFIVDKEFRFSLTINFFDSEHKELKNKFDIHLRSV